MNKIYHIKDKDGDILASVDLSTIKTLGLRTYEQFKRTTYEIFVNDELLNGFSNRSRAQEAFNGLALAFEAYGNQSDSLELVDLDNSIGLDVPDIVDSSESSESSMVNNESDESSDFIDFRELSNLINPREPYCTRELIYGTDNPDLSGWR